MSTADGPVPRPAPAGPQLSERGSAPGPAQPVSRATSASPRLHGLDTLRAVAITLVFAYHYQVFVSGEPTFGWLSTLGWTGVDLFFVLSGYLIANQLLGGLAAGRTLSLPAFFGRRLLRTLPNYWVVLALYFSFPAVMGGKEPPPLWRFLTFTQNLGLQPGTAFSHAWSLCIEEQFYLALPLVLVAGLALPARWRRTCGWALLAGGVLLGVVARGLLWQRYGSEAGGAVAGYHPHIYYATLCRFDEFLPGVALALVRHGHPAAWARLMRLGNLVLALAVVATVVLGAALLEGYYIDGQGYGFAMTTFGYSLVAGCFALWVAAALSPGCVLHGVRVPGAAALAAWSYAAYLTHKPLAVILQRQLTGWGVPPGSPWAVAASIAVCLVGGWLLYRCVESPFMAWRDRRLPSNFPRTTAPAENRLATPGA